MKSLIVGAALVIVGAIIGFGMSMKSQCPMKGKKACVKMQQECMYKNGHHGHYGEGPHCKKSKKIKLGHLNKILVNELSLTDEQTLALDKIFDAKKELRKEKRKEHKANMQSERVKAHNEIKAILTAEQKIKFDNILEKHFPRSK